MFCNQCEQVSKGGGCIKIGTCGKKPDVAALQDLLVHALKGLSLYAVEGRKIGIADAEVDEFTVSALFSTLTNVNFDPERFVTIINKCIELREKLKENVKAAGWQVEFAEGAATFWPENTLDGLVRQGEETIITPNEVNADILSL